jgi:Ca2+-binding EF-hand superfamily protein
MSPQLTKACDQIRKQFESADSNGDNQVTLDEATAQVPSPLQPLIAKLDRDGNHQLSEQELNAWLELQGAIANAHVLVTVLDCGSGLLEALDTDHDGALCYRELLAASSELHKQGCIEGGKLDLAKLPRHFIVVISRGQPTTPLGRPLRPGPTWFNAMDRNGDGDVSRREFTGPIEVFDRLDKDSSGYLSTIESVIPEATRE